MTRSALALSLGLVFVAAATLGSCGGGGTGGTAGTSGGGTAGTSGGTAGTSGGTAGTGGGTAGTNGEIAGTSGSGRGGTTGDAGTSGTAGTSGGTAGAGGRGGTTGNGGRGGMTGDAGTSGTAGRGGAAGGGTTGNGGRGGTTGNGGRGGGSSGGAGGLPGGLTLTSTAFTEGMMIPAVSTCTGNSHMSPPLAWTPAGPTGTMSYAVTLVDTNNGYVHWVIWDLPSTTMSLPANLPTTRTLTTPVMGQQVNRFTGDGYFGPCPSGQTHIYQFEVYAVDVATLPGVTGSPMPETVRAALMMHDLATGTLSGMSNASQN